MIHSTKFTCSPSKTLILATKSM